ncbi:alpha/beta hydrolase family esterase [Asticcacaulis endophyticus]|uniref:Polyhydroxybutyrate depolymerase n=1 Tax=Asticcacaulis endophyticus TaxID=1395890 RepID=A0A918QAH2_9CAUL|nr:PHB depolymerase family esterase [Asticcacaulis endophyticus]GGZ39009.1 polyhydroxybutyrate depolymerase [Asticcacaulis endophyticus]
MKSHQAILSVIVMASFVSGCAAAGAPERMRLRDRMAARAAEAPAIPGVVERSLTLDGARRSYLVLDASRPGMKAPVVVLLHGGGGNGGTMISRWQAKARAEGLILVAPNGIGQKAKAGTWNAGGCCGEAMTSGGNDVHFVATLIDQMSRAANVDANRIFVAGLSNGGMLTHRVAIAMPERLAGVAVVAGAMFGGEPAPRAPVPILIMHGVQDQVVGFNGGMSPTRFVAKAQSKPFKPVRYAVDFWRRADGCTTVPNIVTQGDVTTEVNSDCRAGSEVRFYRLASANHGWPGATDGTTPALERNRYDAINATDVIWDFFKVHSRVD